MNQSSIIARFSSLKRVSYGDLGVWVLVGTLEQPARIIKFQNLTDAIVEISYDGDGIVRDILPADSFALYDLTTNKSESGGCLEFPKGSRIYARYNGDAPSLGEFTVTTIYGSTR